MKIPKLDNKKLKLADKRKLAAELKEKRRRKSYCVAMAKIERSNKSVNDHFKTL